MFHAKHLQDNTELGRIIVHRHVNVYGFSGDQRFVMLVIATEIANDPAGIKISFSGMYTKADHDWDYLLFAQSWPPTVCRIWKNLDSSHTCIFPEIHNAWSIHGIWPTKVEVSEPGPAFCNQSWAFNPEEIKPIEPRLEQAWINVQNGTSTYDFWGHEWSKHGTCAATIKPFNSQIKYFSKALQWLQKYTMATILPTADILPSDTKTYTLNDLYEAIKNKLGVDPNINCLHDKRKQYLRELRICFSRCLKLIDCKEALFRKFYIGGGRFVSNCDPGRVIYSESFVL